MRKNRFGNKIAALAFLSLNVLGTILLISSPLPGVHAAEEQDIVMNALKDEMARSKKELKLPGYDAPYFIEFNLFENDDFSVEASNGAIESRSCRRGRTAYPSVRVGSVKMDNTNFHASAINWDGAEDATTIDDNYGAIRRVLWLLTDTKYKLAVQNLEEKKAYLLEKSSPYELDDYSTGQPLTWTKPVPRLEIDMDLWSDRVRALSSRFRKYDLYDSSARYDERILNTWLVNTEGTMIRNSESSCRYLLFGSIRAKDGMSFSDWEPIISHDRSRLPSVSAVEEKVDSLALRLQQVSQAPLIDDYEGPVLFEGQAAAEFFGQMLTPLMTVSRRKVNDTLIDQSNPFSRKLGKRVMPVFLSVTDDPLTKTYNGIDLFGTYDVDEQGVRAQSVKVIENGVLKTLLSGRTPTNEVKGSNGHGTVGESGTAKFSCIYIDSQNQLKKKQLMDALRKMGKEAGLDYAIVVRRLSNSSRYDEGDMFSTSGWSAGNKLDLSNPILIYKVGIKDGKETLVRGAKFQQFSTQILKSIVATGADTAAYPTETTQNNYYHVITPSILVREVEIERVPADQNKPPALENPLLEAKN